MKKQVVRVLSLLLVFVVAMNFATITFADSEHPFEDIPEDSYYYDSVYRLYRAGIVKGYSATEFKPKNNITKAEILALVSRSMKIDTDSLKTDDKVWYSGVANWAIKEGLVRKSDDLTKVATREDMAFYICKVFNITQTKNKYCVDTNSVYVNSLCEAEIVYGYYTTETNKVYYGAKDSISRADTCVIIDRALTKIGKALAYVDYEVNLDTDMIRLPTTEPVVLSTNPSNVEEFAQIWEYMADSSILEYYVGVCNKFYDLEQLKNVVTDGVRRLRESKIWLSDFYRKTSIRIRGAEENSVELWLLAAKDTSEEDYIKNLNFINQEVDDIIIELLTSNKINYNYLDYENAKAVYEYVVNRIEYDNNGIHNSILDALKYNKATCTGYTSLYNYILYKLGFNVEAQYGLAGDNARVVDYNRNHVWTKIILEDGSVVYVDSTWGDNINNICNYDYFWKTEEELKEMDQGRVFMSYLDFVEYNKAGV